MDSRDDRASKEEKDYRRWRLSRRRLLKLMGVASVTAVAAPLVPRLLSKVDAAEPATNGEAKSRLRKWAMVIDLRRCDGCQGIDLPPQCAEACIEGHYVPEPMQ